MQPTEMIGPTGALGKHLHRLAEVVATAPTFRQKTGTDTREEALGKIELPFRRFRSPQEVDAYFGGITGPAAVLEAETLEWNIDRNVDAVHLRLLLVDFDRYPNSPLSSLTDFLNFVEGTLSDMADQYAAACLPIPRVSLIMPVLDDSRRRGQEGGYWLGGADFVWDQKGV